MTTYALTGNDTLIIQDRLFSDFGDNSTITITFPNEKLGTSTGKNDNTIYATNKQGKNVQVDLRIIVGSKDDVWLNGLSIQQDDDLPSFKLMNATFTKRVGDGNGKVRYINYTLLGGAFRQDIDANENLSGETEQGIALYRLFFAKGERAIL